MNFFEWYQRHPQAWAELSALLTSHMAAPGSAPVGSEAGIQSQLRLTAANNGCSLWRNNSGALMDQEGRLIRFGLGNDSARFNKVWKSSDLIGIGPGGRFTAVEVKDSKWTKPRNEHEKAQANFMANVRALGGIAGFVTSTDQYLRMIGR